MLERPFAVGDHHHQSMGWIRKRQSNQLRSTMSALGRFDDRDGTDALAVLGLACSPRQPRPPALGAKRTC